MASPLIPVTQKDSFELAGMLLDNYTQEDDKFHDLSSLLRVPADGKYIS